MQIPSTSKVLPRKNHLHWILTVLVLAGTGVEFFRFLHLALGWKFWLQWIPATSFWVRLNIPFLLALLGLLTLGCLFTRQRWSNRVARIYLLLWLMLEGLVSVITQEEPFSPTSISVWILRLTSVLVLAIWISMDLWKGKSR